MGDPKRGIPKELRVPYHEDRAVQIRRKTYDFQCCTLIFASAEVAVIEKASDLNIQGVRTMRARYISGEAFEKRKPNRTSTISAYNALTKSKQTKKGRKFPTGLFQTPR
jgi:hypothetical protein